MLKILLTEKQADILHDSIVAYQLNDNEREVDETLNKILDKILKAKRKERNLRKELGLA